MKRRVVYLLGLASCLYVGPAAAWAPPYTQFTLHTGTALEESDNRYAFLLAPNRDLFVIEKNHTGTHSTEVHVLSAASNYRNFILHTGTPQPETGDGFAFALAPNRDLFIIQKGPSGTHSTELHVLSAASNYRSFILHTGTPQPETGDGFAFALAPNRDLFIIQKSPTGTHSTELHVLSAASNYRNFILHTGTALEETDGRWDFVLAPNRDLVAIKKSNTGTGSTELHVLSAASNYRNFTVQNGTPLEETDDRYAFAMPATGPSDNHWSQLAGNNLPDLFAIKKSGTGTHSTEVHVLAAASRGGVPSVFPVSRQELHIRIDQPPVTRPRTPFPEIRFREGDRVLVASAGGCVQTGGHGKTWKRYVDPEGDNSDHLYRGQIKIPTVTDDLETIQGYMARQRGARNVSKLPAGVDPAELHLELGYQDDQYDDNSYNARDSGNGCDRLPDAWIELAVTHPPPSSTPQAAGPVLPMDVWWTEVDDNLLPLNPKWGAQVKEFPGIAPRGLPDAGGLCNHFPNEDDALDLGPHCTTARPDVDEPSFWHNAAYYTACHSDGGGGVVAGHINWGLATFQGRIYFVKHDLPYPQASANPFSSSNGDDDYNLEFLRTDEAATTQGNGTYTGTPSFPGSEQYKGKHQLDIEFDSDETVDIFSNSQTGWWNDFHRLVDAGGGHSTALDGAEATLIGVLGIDNMHGAHAELHPILGFAAKVPPSSISPDTGDDHWVFFARRQGDEGGCSQSLHPYGQDQMSFLLSIPANAKIRDARFDSYPTGMAWDEKPLPDGRLITFRLPPLQGDSRSGILWGEFWVHDPSAPRAAARASKVVESASLLRRPEPERSETMEALGAKLTASQKAAFQTHLEALEKQAKASRPRPVVATGVRASLGATARHHTLDPNEPRTLTRHPKQQNPEREAANARRMQALSHALGGTDRATEYLGTITRVPRNPRTPDGAPPARGPRGKLKAGQVTQ